MFVYCNRSKQDSAVSRPNDVECHQTSFVTGNNNQKSVENDIVGPLLFIRLHTSAGRRGTGSRANAAPIQMLVPTETIREATRWDAASNWSTRWWIIPPFSSLVEIDGQHMFSISPALDGDKSICSCRIWYSKKVWMNQCQFHWCSYLMASFMPFNLKLRHLLFKLIPSHRDYPRFSEILRDSPRFSEILSGFSAVGRVDDHQQAMTATWNQFYHDVFQSCDNHIQLFKWTGDLFEGILAASAGSAEDYANTNWWLLTLQATCWWIISNSYRFLVTNQGFSGAL